MSEELHKSAHVSSTLKTVVLAGGTLGGREIVTTQNSASIRVAFCVDSCSHSFIGYSAPGTFKFLEMTYHATEKNNVFKADVDADIIRMFCPDCLIEATNRVTQRERLAKLDKRWYRVAVKRLKNTRIHISISFRGKNL